MNGNGRYDEDVDVLKDAEHAYGEYAFAPDGRYQPWYLYFKLPTLSGALTVGGALSAKSKKDYTIYVAGKSSETVGAAKTVASSDGSLTEAVGGDVTMTVGGALVETVEGNCVSSAQGDMQRTVGAIGSLTITGKLQMRAKTIKINVTGAVTFLGAGGVVSLSPASVGFVGLVTLKGSGGVEIAGAPQLAG